MRLNPANNYSKTWSYDAAGNPTGGTYTPATGTPTSWARTFDKTLYQYDGNGNPTLYRGVAAAYDARDRMIAWGRMRAGYRSDGKRAWKILLDESGNEVSRQYFLYDGDNLLCELDGQLRVTSTSTWGANGLVSRATNSYDGSGNPTDGKSTFYAYDERGSVAERVTDSGSGSPVVNHVAFDAWGYGTAGDSVGFGGKWGYYTDTETGLILCTHRYYDPSKQRWVTRDPIEYDGGINLYGYGANNPLNYVDPDGLMPILAPGASFGPAEFDMGMAGGGPPYPEWYIDVMIRERRLLNGDLNHEIIESVANSITPMGGTVKTVTNVGSKSAPKVIEYGTKLYDEISTVCLKNLSFDKGRKVLEELGLISRASSRGTGRIEFVDEFERVRAAWDPGTKKWPENYWHKMVPDPSNPKNLLDMNKYRESLNKPIFITS